MKITAVFWLRRANYFAISVISSIFVVTNTLYYWIRIILFLDRQPHWLLWLVCYGLQLLLESKLDYNMPRHYSLRVFVFLLLG